jgi:hypothetical protein
LGTLAPTAPARAPLSSHAMQPPRRLTGDQIIAAARFAAKAGIGPLFAPPPCHGYANCCRCSACTALAEQIAERGFTPDGKVAPPAAKPQPWDPA